MIQVEPKVRGFLCTTAHPLGCLAHVEAQRQMVEQGFDRGQHPLMTAEPEARPTKVLIIGGSAGYGLASRITCALGYGADTLSVAMEKPARGVKPASAGWYNNFHFEQIARQKQLYAESIDGDAFSDTIKQQTIATIKAQLGEVDLVVYSLAAPRRTIVTESGEQRSFSSAIKPIGQAYSGRTIDTKSGTLTDFHLESATHTEIEHTVAVMGGEDWYLWMKALSDADVLSANVKTVAFSYLGGDMTKAIYGAATLGAAKEDVEYHCGRINRLLGESSVAQPLAQSPQATVAVLKAIVTQSSAAIPSLPLYISVLYKVMKQKGLHEGCIDQIVRLFQTGLYPDGRTEGALCQMDKPFRFRLDELELRADVQQDVARLWSEVDESNLHQVTDVASYQQDFLRLFGFEWPSIDYQQAVEVAL